MAKCIAASVSKLADDVPILLNLSISTAISSCNCFATDSFSLQCKRLSQEESSSANVKEKRKKEKKNHKINEKKWNYKK